MKKILIIDRDSTILNDISRLVTALKYEPVVAFNIAALAGLIKEEIAAVFIDVETKMINVEDVVKYFNNGNSVGNGAEIPIFLMHSNKSAYYLKHAKRLPHAGLIEKPFELENIFKILQSQLDFDSITYEQFSNQYKLNQLKNYADSMSEWLEKFGALLEA